LNKNPSSVVELIRGRIENQESLESGFEDLVLTRLSGLPSTDSNSICFFFSPKYKNDLAMSAPGLLVTAPDFVRPIKESGSPIWKKSVIVSCDEPYLAMARLSQAFDPSDVELLETRIHPTAAIEPSAVISSGVEIGAHVSIGAGTTVGKGSKIFSGVCIGDNVRIGESCRLFSNVTVYSGTEIGNRVRIHSGAVIGSDGFGYAQRVESGEIVEHVKIHHFGKAIIEDDVEIGANTCIDRGTMSNTVIKAGSKLDNLVQIAHNCVVGERSIFCGKSGMAGSSSIGKGVFVGGLVAINNKVHVGDGAKIGPCTGVTKNVRDGEIVRGFPMRSEKDYMSANVVLNRLVKNQKTKNDRRREV